MLKLEVHDKLPGICARGEGVWREWAWWDAERVCPAVEPTATHHNMLHTMQISNCTHNTHNQLLFHNPFLFSVAYNEIGYASNRQNLRRAFRMFPVWWGQHVSVCMSTLFKWVGRMVVTCTELWTKRAQVSSMWTRGQWSSSMCCE
jgi:hypothetical protein